MKIARQASAICIRLFSLLIVVSSAFSANTVEAAPAAEIFYVDENATGANNGTTWADAFTDLQSALAVAGSGDEIWVAEGTYVPGQNRAATFLVIDGLSLFGAFPSGGGGMSDRDFIANPTFLSGDIGTPGNNADNSYHVVSLETAIIDGFTIESGNANVIPNHIYGGGINQLEHGPTLRNLIIQNNFAYYGGGIHAGGSAKFENVQFLNNSAGNSAQLFSGGGAMYVDFGYPVLRNVYFQENTVTNGDGGAIYLEYAGVAILNGDFISNTVTTGREYGGGGAIFVHNTSPYLANVVFKGNRVHYTGGYGSTGGGALYNYLGSPVIVNGVFVNNRVTATQANVGHGGAIYDKGSLMVLSNSTFYGNSTNGLGSGIFSSELSSQISISNSIFWGNQNAYPFSYLNNNNVTYSIVQGGYIGTGNINADPEFINPSAGNFSVAYDSPAIDAGNNLTAITDTRDYDNDSNTTEIFPVDIDRNTRLFDMPLRPNVGEGEPPVIDMGAYEIHNSAPVINNSGDPYLSSILEDATLNTGTRIIDILSRGMAGDPISDSDTNQQEGIAIIGLETANGSWQYSINGGTNWLIFGNVSSSSATLLNAGSQERIRFVPSANFVGILDPAITFRAWDQSDAYINGSSGINIYATGGAYPYSTNTETARIEVVAVNDPPTLDSISSLSILEDAGDTTVPLTGISAGPANEIQVITVTASINNASLIPDAIVNYTSANPTGTFVFTPTQNANGTVTATILVQDSGGLVNGGSNTSSRSFLITVNPVNDAPVFTAGSDQAVLEDDGQKIINAWATGISAGPSNESSQLLTFTLTPDHPELFAAQPQINATTGDLSFTPAANAVGQSIVTVILTDNGGTANGGTNSYSDEFTITIQPVNDAPNIVMGAVPSILEDAGAQIFPGWASQIVAGPPDENGQSLSITLQSATPDLFTVPPVIDIATGNLTFTPAPNSFGSTNISVQLQDNGGTANGGINIYTTSFTITINSVNDAPGFVSGVSPTVLEDSGAHVLANWASSISKGPSNENDQSLTFTLVPDRPDLFSIQPRIDSASGTLTYTPAPNAFGSSTITTILQDNGGTLNGGVDQYQTSFLITIYAVNDLPTVSSIAKSVEQGGEISFSLADFTSAFHDIDGESLTKIKITSLPAQGTIRLNGVDITQNQEIDETSIPDLTYTALSIGDNEITFGWNASDGYGYALTNGTVVILISPTPSQPTKLYLPAIIRQQGAPPPPPPTQWTTLIQEDFEGAFPSGWELGDYSGAGEYLWGRRICRTYSGNFSGWAIGAGANGQLSSCGSNYPYNADSWMVYGPVNLQNASAANLQFVFWLNSELDYDKLCVMASVNNDNFSGNCMSGYSNGWRADDLDLSSVGSLGSLLGKQNVWIAFIFRSDDSVNYSEGAYIDNISLKMCTNPSGCSSNLMNLGNSEQNSIVKVESSMTRSR